MWLSIEDAIAVYFTSEALDLCFVWESVIEPFQNELAKVEILLSVRVIHVVF
jgi:hypothetical protein